MTIMSGDGVFSHATIGAAAPGPRGHLPNAYAAYLRDPFGNKVCAYTFEGELAK